MAPAPALIRSAPLVEPLRRAAAPAVGEELCGEDVVLVRPYLVAWERRVERELERERQRDRWTVAAFAAGAGFPGVPA